MAGRNGNTSCWRLDLFMHFSRILLLLFSRKKRNVLQIYVDQSINMICFSSPDDEDARGGAGRP